MTRLAALALPVALGLGALVPAQPADKPKPGYLTDKDVMNSCSSCHEAPRESNKQSGADQFVLLYESVYWQQHDLHYRAHAALTSPLGQQMSERLYGDKGRVAKESACLVCHGTDTRPDAGLGVGGPDRFHTISGVNCQACHGPADAWVGVHWREDWRTAGPVKKAEYGMVNLREPAVRAEKCVSCHVGSVAEHKFVTHEMYAAGHPPLPAFELATFSRDEPKHWRQPAAVEYITKLPSDDAKRLFSYRGGEVEAARLAAVGAVTALRESARLVVAAPAGEPLDFAHFNCAACHHELVVPSDRQRNGFPGVAGRPVPTAWPAWATRAVLRHDTLKAVAPQFETAYGAWRQAFDAAPFGDPKAVTTAAAGLEAACGAVLTQLDAARFDRPSAQTLITAFVAEADAPTGRRDYLDADAAGLLARASATITAELADPPKPGSSASPTPPAPPKFDDGPLAKLHATVGLAVREADDNKTLLQARQTYATRAKRAFDYRAANFRAAFAEFATPRP